MVRLTSFWMLYVLILGIFPLILATRSYVWGRGGYAFLNRTNMDVLKGLSILLLIFQSVCERLANGNFITDIIAKSGVLGAVLFLFVCGYEVMTQYVNNRRYLKGFVFHQVIRILCVFLVCNVIGALVNIYLGGHDGFTQILQNTLTFHFADGTSASLIGALLYFYVAFFVSYRTKYRMNLLLWLSVGFIGLSLLFRWDFSLAFCFFIGVFVAKYKKYLFIFIKKYYAPFLVISLFLFINAYMQYLKGSIFIVPLLPYLFLVALLCVCMKLQLRSHVFKMLGYGAIEFYLVHELLLNLFLGYSDSQSAIFVMVFISVGLLSALVIRGISCRMFFVPVHKKALK